MAIFNYQAPKVTFSLRNLVDKQGKKALYVKVYIDGGYVMKSTDIWLKPSQWDPAAQMVVNSREANALNEVLKALKSKIDRLILTNYGNIATADDIRALLNGKDPEKRDQIDFFEYAHDVNQTHYDKGKYGYRCWYAKERNIEMFKTFVNDRLNMSSLTLEDLNVSIFDKYIAYRLNELKNTSREGINKTLAPLYEAVKYAVKNGLFDQAAATPIVENYLNLRATKYSESQNQEKVKYLTETEMAALSEFWRNRQPGSRKDALDIFFFSFYSCGLRASDLVTLEWKNIDFKKNEIKKVQVKTKKTPSVTIPLSSEAVRILERWQGRNSKYVFDWLPENFNIKDAAQLTVKINGFDRVMNGHLNRTGSDLKFNKHLTLHMARHTFAVMALNNGVDVYMISKLLGHSSIIATEKTYAEFMKEKIDIEAKKILEMKF